MSEPVIIKQILAGPYQVFTYIVACSQTLEGVVIDPAGDEDKLLTFIQSKKIQVKYIFNTHGHADHGLGNLKVKNIFNVPICMHEADHRFFSDAGVREETSKELGLPPPDPVDKKLKDGDVLEVGNLNLEVIHTPGHTPGSACYLIDGNLFTGDTLFVGAAGRTDLIGGSLQTLIESLEKRLILLPKETIVWPGHDYGEHPKSTIGQEIEENPYITDFILD